jgi:tetratricopeptide (TPR) repeat protein
MKGLVCGLILAAGCGSTEPPPPTIPLAELPPISETLPPLSAEEQKFELDQVAQAAADLIEKRESEGSLERAAALLRFHWQRHSAALSLNTMLAQVHVHFIDRYDLKNAEHKDPLAKHREAGRIHAREALRVNPDHGPAHYWYGHILLHVADAERSYGKLKEALAQMEKAEKTASDIDHHGPIRMQGRIYQETPGGPFFLGDKKKAQKFYERAVQASPEYLQHRLWLAEIHIDAKKFEPAREQIDFILKAAPRKGHEKDDRKIQEAARKLLEKIPAQK